METTLRNNKENIMSIKTIVLYVLCMISGLSFASPACKKCKNTGYDSEYITCPLCSGHGTVSPAWFGKTTDTVRWTETTHLMTGIQTTSDYRYKKMSFVTCVLCGKSPKRGYLKTLKKCDCGAVISSTTISSAKSSIKKLFTTSVKSDSALKGEYDDNTLNSTVDGMDDFDAVRIKYEMKCWSLSNPKSKDYCSLIIQALNSGKYDVEGANYLRNTSKKDLKDK